MKRVVPAPRYAGQTLDHSRVTYSPCRAVNIAATLVLFALGLCLGGCGRRAPVAPRTPVSAKKSEKRPGFSREEVLQRFRSRVSADQVREFDRLRSFTDSESQSRARAMVLFSLTAEELFSLGVTETQQPRGTEWAVAWGLDSEAVSRAVHSALDRAGVVAGGSCDLGYCGWYVPKAQFFQARQALLQASDVRSLDVKVVEPRFDL